jgi:phospholipid N-methyltransferase
MAMYHLVETLDIFYLSCDFQSPEVVWTYFIHHHDHTLSGVRSKFNRQMRMNWIPFSQHLNGQNVKLIDHVFLPLRQSRVVFLLTFSMVTVAVSSFDRYNSQKYDFIIRNDNLK